MPAANTDSECLMDTGASYLYYLNVQWELQMKLHLF